jgi:hypothetical protein
MQTAGGCIFYALKQMLHNKATSRVKVRISEVKIRIGEESVSERAGHAGEVHLVSARPLTPVTPKTKEVTSISQTSSCLREGPTSEHCTCL